MQPTMSTLFWLAGISKHTRLHSPMHSLALSTSIYTHTSEMCLPVFSHSIIHILEYSILLLVFLKNLKCLILADELVLMLFISRNYLFYNIYLFIYLDFSTSNFKKHYIFFLKSKLNPIKTENF